MLGVDIKDWYKLKKKVNVKIKWILRVLKFSDFVYWINLVNTGKVELLYNWEYDFDNEDYKDLFSDILALDYIWALNLEIKNIDSRDNWNYKTNLTKNSHPYSLYNTFSKDRDKIEKYSSMQIEIKYMTPVFLREFMKVIYQEKKVDKLANCKIVDELIEYIKSEIWWKGSFLWKIELFYDLDTYLKELHSIYPILIELEKLWYLEVFDLELKEWKIVFKIKNISKIDLVEKGKIVDIFWSKDEYEVIKDENSETLFINSWKLDIKLMYSINALVFLVDNESIWELNLIQSDFWKILKYCFENEIKEIDIKALYEKINKKKSNEDSEKAFRQARSSFIKKWELKSEIDNLINKVSWNKFRVKLNYTIVK